MIIPLGLILESIDAYLFSTTYRVGWDSSNFAPYFISGAMVAGIGALVSVVYIVRRNKQLESYITEYHFDKMGKLFNLACIIYLYFNINEYLVPLFTAKKGESEHLETLLRGDFAIPFWIVTLIGLVLPAILLIFKRFRKPKTHVLHCRSCGDMFLVEKIPYRDTYPPAPLSAHTGRTGILEALFSKSARVGDYLSHPGNGTAHYYPFGAVRSGNVHRPACRGGRRTGKHRKKGYSMKEVLNNIHAILKGFTCVLLAFCIQTGLAQDKERLRLSTSYTKVMDGPVYLDFQTSARIDKTNVTVPDAELEIYYEVDGEEFPLGTTTTGPTGKAQFTLKGIEAIEPDSTGLYIVGATFAGDETFRKASSSVEFRDAVISAKLVQKDSLNFIEATLKDKVLDSTIARCPYQSTGSTYVHTPGGQ